MFLLDGDLMQAVGGGLDEYGIESGEEELILAREVNLDGRNTCRVNGRIVPLRLLNGLAEHLVDIHGQNEHLSLLRVREHIDILDKYGGLGELRSEVGARGAGVDGGSGGVGRDESGGTGVCSAGWTS